MKNNINKKILTDSKKRVSRPTSNGMKKNKTNYQKIIKLFLFICICLFSSSITVGAYYEYRNGGVAQTQICGYTTPDFADPLTACNTRVKTLCGDTTTASCVFSPEKCNDTAEVPVCPTVVDLNPNKSISTDTYTLLAPIGEMTTAPTNFGDYANKILLIVIGLCGVLAVVMIVIGGFMYMGDESVFGKTEAKGQITRAILGLLIALGAYALLNTINPDLLNTNVSIKAVSAVIEPLYDRGINDAKKANGESVRCTPVTSGPCSVANLTTVFGAANAEAMSKICNMESGGTSVASGTDYCVPPGKSLPFSFGLFQINLAANGILAGTDCANLFDRKVSSVDAITPKYTSGFTCSLLSGKEALYETCKNRLLDTTINLSIAKNLFTESKSAWIGDKKYCASAFN